MFPLAPMPRHTRDTDEALLLFKDASHEVLTVSHASKAVGLRVWVRNFQSLFSCSAYHSGFIADQTHNRAISVSPRVCFVLVLVLISMFLR